MSGFRQILVPIDYSAPSTAALRLAAEIAIAFQGRLIVLHLLPIEVYAFADCPMVAPDDIRLDQERARVQAHVHEVLGYRPPAFEAEVSWGSPFLQIVDHAIDRHADLIVIGTHGRTGVKHAFLGSVAEKTVRLAPCPVLTVHDGATIPSPLHTAEPTATGRTAVKHGTAGDVMTRNPLAARSTDTLEIANASMLEAGARHLPVVDEGKLVGILADRDIQPHLGHLAHTRVNAAMSPDPTTVSPDVTTTEAARLMLEHRVRALPVVDGERLIGILTSTDILEEYLLVARR